MVTHQGCRSPRGQPPRGTEVQGGPDSRTQCRTDPGSPESLTQPEALFAFSVFRVFSELGSHSQNTAWLSREQTSSLVLWGRVGTPEGFCCDFPGGPRPPFRSA